MGSSSIAPPPLTARPPPSAAPYACPAGPDGLRHAKIADFGLAKRLTGGPGITAQSVVGTMPYTCPEIIQQEQYRCGRGCVIVDGHRRGTSKCAKAEATAHLIMVSTFVTTQLCP